MSKISFKVNAPLQISSGGRYAFARKEQLVCDSATKAGLEEWEMAVLLGLARWTGWSAELISHKLQDSLQLVISAEMVWDAYFQWKTSGGKNENSLEDEDEHTMVDKDPRSKECLDEMLALESLERNSLTIPLSSSIRPISVPFSFVWSPESRAPIFDDFNDTDRLRSIKILSWQTDEIKLTKPTVFEKIILEQLGPNVMAIVMAILPRWIGRVKKAQSRMPYTKPIRESPNMWRLICRYATIFKNAWEILFGKMEDNFAAVFTPGVKCSPINIVSTGSASKVFFCLMLIIRMDAMEKQRKLRRENECFKEVPLTDLPRGVRECCICQVPLGMPDQNGETEVPIRVLSCCGNYFGINCLRRWFGEFGNAKCPLCNWPASCLFIDKLCYRYDPKSTTDAEDSGNESMDMNSGDNDDTGDGPTDPDRDFDDDAGNEDMGRDIDDDVNSNDDLETEGGDEESSEIDSCSQGSSDAYSSAAIWNHIFAGTTLDPELMVEENPNLAVEKDGPETHNADE